MKLSEKIARQVIPWPSWYWCSAIRSKVMLSGLRGAAKQSTADAVMLIIVKWEYPANYRKWLKGGGMKKISEDGLIYKQESISLAFSFYPNIYPCKHCGHPIVRGYCCNHCQSSNPSGKD